MSFNFAIAAPVPTDSILQLKLSQAVELGAPLEAMRAILQGANPNALKTRGEYEFPLLQKAVLTGNADLVRVLLSRGANPNMRDSHGTPILVSLASLRMGLKNGDQIWASLTHLLQARGLEIDAHDKADLGDHRTALHAAAAQGDTELVQLLLLSGANPNSLNRYGETPLHLATEKGHTAAALRLLRRGSAVETKSKFTSVTPLMLAAERGNFELVQHFITASKSPNLLLSQKDTFGRTPASAARAALAKKPNNSGRLIQTLRWIEQNTK